MKLRISGQSKEDLIELWEYIATHDEVAADRYLDQLRVRSLELLQHPQMGRLRSEIHVGVRSLLFRNHLIFYRMEGSTIQILRILHGSMNLPNQEFTE